MLVEQAVFTSVRGTHREGYQLVAASRGISETDHRDLSCWGPAHDSLLQPGDNASSINFHQLTSGAFCISYTTCAGAEYSGRGGARIYTQNFVLPQPLLAKFSNQPFRVLEALTAAGHLQVLEQLPERLEPIRLLGRGSPVNPNLLCRLTSAPGPVKLASLLAAAMGTDALAVTCSAPPERLFAGLLDLLPVNRRTEFSLSTGLKFSPRRSFRLAVLPDDLACQRQTVRQSGAIPLDLTGEPPQQFLPRKGWPALVLDVLRSGRITLLADVVAAAENNEPNLDQLADRLREDFRVKAGGDRVLVEA